MSARRFRKALPDQSGWWLWKEDSDSDPVKLLVNADGKNPEIATDEAYSRATKQDYPLKRDDNYEENYWAETACAEMGGLWQLEIGFDINKSQP